MTDLSFISSLVKRVQRLSATAQEVGAGDAFIHVSIQLAEALQRLDSDDTNVPVVRIALLGGTGAGKSALFNALIGRKDASPTSGDVRCFTKQPYVAASRKDRPLLNLPDDLQPKHIDVDLDGVALIDTPDIDGVLKENWHAARAIVRRADIVVYVTIPDRRAEFQVHEEVRQWAARKRWFFVLNKADLVKASELADVRRDFDKRLRELGFAPGDAVRFTINATNTGDHDFTQLRKALFNVRVAESVPKLRADGFLGWAQQALSDENVNPIEHIRKTLADREADLNDRITKAYQKGLRNGPAERAFRVVVREFAWRNLGERIGWLMGLAVWVRARLSALTASYYVARLGLGQLGLLGLAKAAVALFHAMASGALPIRRILASLGPGYREELRMIQADVRRCLQDLQLSGLAPAAPPRPEDPCSPTPQVEGAPGALREFLTATINACRTDDFEGEVEQIQTDLENLAEEAARRVGPGWIGLLTNLFPTAFACHALWRLGEAWWHKAYLPGTFYLIAGLLLVASLLPGYLVLALRMRRECLRLDPSRLVENLERPVATAPIRTADDRLRDFLGEARSVRNALRELRRELDSDLISATSIQVTESA